MGDRENQKRRKKMPKTIHKRHKSQRIGIDFSFESKRFNQLVKDLSEWADKVTVRDLDGRRVFQTGNLLVTLKKQGATP